MAGKKVLLVNPMYPDTEVKKYLDLVQSDLPVTNIDSALLRENSQMKLIMLTHINICRNLCNAGAEGGFSTIPKDMEVVKIRPA